ncbi:polysaccharide biosynthesis tyrosine autokinase [Cellulomonas phragmiteti]|uniref:Chromosome partitioning protein n=1 Tax=Cellulomonas phragmiteti TaxID=478780 RepID=A0ABQ4DHJ2_9CELL|nr:polysaccharide biosynthesis tyrosine autokinase [Cellulomonas phragmiteti]GIG38800.1 chromosome partitioning protein [Cellulomonas phragmiteti]
MELSDYLAIARKRWVSIGALSIAGLAGALGVSLLTTPVYTATTQLFVSVQGGGSSSDMLQGANFTRQQVASYTRIVTSPLVLGPVIDDLGLGIRASELAQNITSESPLNSSLVNISVSDPSPAVAAALANAVAAEFRDVVAELERPTDGSPSPVKLTVVRDAAAPISPSSPKTGTNAALGLLVGLAIGIGTALLREILDTSIRSESTVAQVTDTAVVGVIAHDESATSRPLIVQSDPHSPRAESFRRLRTNIQFLNVGSRPSSIVVTSAVPGEGKSTTTINLAIALAEAGSRVVLVDADLRRPAVAKYLGLEGTAGLTTVLIGRATVSDVAQPWGNGMLHVIPSGQIPPNPSELLGSRAMSVLVDGLVNEYDIVLIDTPPLLPVTDAAVASKWAGGVLVVVGSGKVHRNQLTEALGALETVGAHTLGIVVNREPRKRASSYEYYRYSSDERGKGRGASEKSNPRVPLEGPASHGSATRKTGAIDVVRATQTEAPAAWPATGLSEDLLAEEREGLPPQHLRGERHR